MKHVTSISNVTVVQKEKIVTVLTRGFFIHHLCLWFNNDVAGQSMHAGGATSLAENGIAPHIIQGIGWWASVAWQIYIRKHPVHRQCRLNNAQSCSAEHAPWTPARFKPLSFTFTLERTSAWTLRTLVPLFLLCTGLELGHYGRVFSWTTYFCICHSSHRRLISPPYMHTSPHIYRTIGVP